VTAPELSIAVITRNRAMKLNGFLESAARIESERPWELVVVDNDSTDETPAVLANAREAFPVPLRSVVERTPGVARARNRAWHTALAPIVAFTNDDCYLPTDYVGRLLAAFDRDDRLGFVGGSVIRHDPDDDKLGNVSRSEPFEFRPGMFITPGALITANLAFRKAVLESLGGFDEVFAYGNGLVGDDVDAVARASADGWRGLFDPELVVRHHHGRRSFEEVDAVQRGYDAGRGAFFAKCVLDRRLRRVYTGGWVKMTAEQLARGEVRKTVRELGGAARYLAIRLRDERPSPMARTNRPP
jgi:glycosyltransferase involved in cell wall biosynthesis